MTSKNSVISIGHHVMIAYCIICSKWTIFPSTKG